MYEVCGKRKKRNTKAGNTNEKIRKGIAVEKVKQLQLKCEKLCKRAERRTL